VDVPGNGAMVLERSRGVGMNPLSQYVSYEIQVRKSCQIRCPGRGLTIIYTTENYIWSEPRNREILVSENILMESVMMSVRDWSDRGAREGGMGIYWGNTHPGLSPIISIPILSPFFDGKRKEQD